MRRALCLGSMIARSRLQAIEGIFAQAVKRVVFPDRPRAGSIDINIHTIIAPFKCGSDMLGLFDALPGGDVNCQISFFTLRDSEALIIPLSKIWGSQIPPLFSFAPSQRRVRLRRGGKPPSYTAEVSGIRIYSICPYSPGVLSRQYTEIHRRCGKNGSNKPYVLRVVESMCIRAGRTC